jgi:hypothetical protein
MSSKDTIQKAFGGIPNEVVPSFDLDWIRPIRGVKYYYYKLVRYFTR